MNGENLIDLLDKLQLIVFRKLPTFFKSHLSNLVSYASLIIYEKDLTGKTPVTLIDAEIEVDVHCASSNDIEKITRVAKTNRKKILERLDNGHLCFVTVEREGKIVGYCWVAFNEIYLSEIDRKMMLLPEEANIYDAFIFHEHRRKKVYQRMLGTICRWIKGKGFQRVYISSLSINIPSRKGIEKAGFKKRGTVTAFRLFGLIKYREKWKGVKLYLRR